MSIAVESSPLHLVARTVALPATDLLSALPAEGPLAWVRRGEGLVGWGCVARFQASGPDRFTQASAWWTAMVERAVVRDEVLTSGTGPVAFGSFSFADDDEGERPGGGGGLIVPSVIVGRRGDLSWLTTIGTSTTLPIGADQALGELDPVRRIGQIAYAQGALSAGQWTDAVRGGIDAIRGGRCEKVVLARDVVASASEPIDPRAVLATLAQEYPACWTFSVDGLLGATPELLVRTERGLVTSRVLAGTIRRTDDDTANLARAAALARSSKDREEHEYAVDSVAAALAPYCSSVNVPESPYVLHLPNVMHLASDVTGVLRRDGSATWPSALRVAATCLDVVGALHPTAAVCGTPTAAARDLIGELEGMDRGRYSGPVGWIGSDGDGEWGIALRCGQLADDGRSMRLFAGGGIVAASIPADELAETEAKLAPMRQALAE